MTRSSDVKSIFGKALELASTADRAAHLDQACGDDVALRAELEGLLEALANVGQFMSHPVGPLHGVAVSNEIDETIGAPIGPYKLLQKLGEGGMGTVYLAEQEQPVKRHVALKVIKAGMDSRQVVARFEQERQALAMMDHPNIAKVLDAGTTEDDRPYVVMELVKGIPIAQYCDQERLSPRERLELFIPVCHAVQHAHQKGIIHRDLKPSNVMIALYDGVPIPKVIDFGVAKAIGRTLAERTLFTEVGVLVGTLEYMAPEQAELNNLDIDTRADIYSLGVILYELLTGAPPFTSKQLRDAGFAEMLRVIKEVEPPKPSTKLSSSEELPSIAATRKLEPKSLTKLVTGELDWIVMKCLEKDRGRRYDAANGLARDIQRYLDDEPVEAGPPSRGYRLRKYARKYKKVLATVGAFAALLVAATVISIGFGAWALKERNHAEVQKQEAETNFKTALDAVDQMLTRVGEAQLLNVPQMEPVRRELLQDALRFYQEFLRKRGHSPLVRSAAASAYRRVGQIQVQLGQRDEGEEAYRQAAVHLEKLLAEFPDDSAFRNQLAGIHHDLGALYLFSQRWPQAEAALQQAIAILEQLERQHPTLVMNRYDQAMSQDTLGNLYRQMGRLGQAEAAYLKSVALLDGLLAGDPRNVQYSTLLAGCHQNGALVYGAQGRTADAEITGQKAVALNQQLVRDCPEAVHHQKRLAGTHNNLGLLYSRDRQHAKAEAAYKQSLALTEAILRDHPKVVAFMVDAGASYSNMATHVRRSRSPEESLEWSARAIRTLEPVLEQDPRDLEARASLFDALHGRGQALLQLRRREDAAKDWRRMIDLSAGQPHINMLLHRPTHLARLGEHVQATAEVETLLAEGHVQALNLYMFAGVHSIGSAAAANDARLPPAERETLVDKYGGRAVELLRRAQTAGYFRDADRLARMKVTKDLDAIRSRPDFQSLLVELDKK